MCKDEIDLYLELMKKTLTFSLWEEPVVPQELFSYKMPFIKRIFVNILNNILKTLNLRIYLHKRSDVKQIVEGKVLPLLAHTMIGLKRLNNIQYCVESILKDKIPGDFIEAGVWRGGAVIFMRAILKAYGIKDRRVFVADSFQGLPKPDLSKYPQDQGDIHYLHEPLVVSEEEVKDNFRKYGLLDDQVVFLKGWFKDTLSKIKTDKLSIMRLDGDMYGSTIESLVNLYPKLQSGGYCIIDDYALKGAKQAVDDYRNMNGINEKIESIDWTGVYWRKK